MGAASRGQRAGRRRSVWRAFSDSNGYAYRILRRRQAPVRFDALPSDLKWQRAAMALFVLSFTVDLVLGATWSGDARIMSFVAFVTSTSFSVHCGTRDTSRWTREWVGISRDVPREPD